MLKSNWLLTVIGSIALAVSFVAMLPSNASAGMEVNSRLAYGNVHNYCDNSMAFAKGMVWVSNQSDYYSEAVAVGQNDNTVPVTVRGALNTCRTLLSYYYGNGNIDIRAVNVSSLTPALVINGTNFYRGTVNAGSQWAWSTPGHTLSATLNVANVARCDPGNTTGRATGYVDLEIYRSLQYTRPGWSADGGDGKEGIRVPITRTCPTHNYSITPSASADRTTASPGQTIRWTHTVRNNGPTATNRATNYYYQNSNGLGAGQGGANNFATNSASGASASFSSTYNVTDADLGKTLCRSTVAVPRSHSDSSAVSSAAVCVQVNYNYTLVPTISNITDGSSIEGSTGTVPVGGRVTNAGTTKSHPGIRWQLTQVEYGRTVTLGTIPNKGGGSSPGDPCAFFTGRQYCASLDNGSGTEPNGYANGSSIPYNLSGLIADRPVGTKICFAMSVQRESSSSTNWRHSALHCLVVGKKPKVQVLGGDLFVGRTLAGVTRPSGTTGQVVTSTSSNSSGIFGSWGEYAISATGLIKRMASGSGNAGGSAANVNLLTFTNSNGGALGNFTLGSSMPNVASRFSSTGSSLSGTVNLASTGAGTYRGVAGGTLRLSAATLGSGKSVIINSPDTDVVIEGDIRYDDGPFSSISQIPQLVIIARNITINANVTQVDAWLIANGKQSGVNIADGVIRTCQTNVSSASFAADCGANPQPLIVNGPVIANKLLMLRTAGAGTGAAAGDPAEVFNLRPDAYLWAMQQGTSSGRASVVNTKELPPRY